jgi:sulfotransferase
MIQQIFYQSSLPRSGSTLFQNLISQRPDLYASPTSGLLELIYAARSNYSSSPEFKAQDSELMKSAFLNFCKEGMNGYYNSITDKPYILDKSRGWGIHYEFLNSVFPNPKIICLVRDIRAIISSMEKKFRQNQHQHDNIINHAEMSGTTTPKRVDIWLSSQPIGLAIERLEQMIREKIDNKILFIKYEELCINPKREMDKVYNFLEIPYYEHDFDNVEQVTKEDDEVYGIYGDHKIRRKVEPLKPDYNDVLGRDVSSWIYNHYKWYNDYFDYKL